MTTLLVTRPVIGLEEIQRAAYWIMFEHINAVLAEIATYWDSSDRDKADRLNIPYVATELEPVAPENFHEGHRPSLIRNNTPLTSYPNISVMAVRANPSSNDRSMDQMSSYEDTIHIETMVKGEDEETVQRRIHRTVEAINIVMWQNPTLNGTITGLEDAVIAEISNVFVKKEKNAYGTPWLWQGAALTYSIRKDAIAPAPTGSVFGSADNDPALLRAAGIDQG